MGTLLNTGRTMTIQTLIDKLKKTNEHQDPIRKFTLIVNEKSETQGALFFVPVESKEYKILVPAPFHLDLVSEENKPSHIKILMHKEALLLK